MSVLIPFEKCKARPNEQNREFLLKDHLLYVQEYTEKWVKNNDEVLIKLIGLAGVCHDIAKSHKDWQVYINSNSADTRGPTHAPASAFLFSFFGYNFLKVHDKWEKYRIYWFRLIRDIADHHGTLKRLLDDYWIRASDWDLMDLEGINNFIQGQYLELKDIKLSEELLDDWLFQIDDLLEEVMDELDLGYDSPPLLQLMKQLQLWRNLTTSLIAGDRFDVKSTDTIWFDKEEFLRCDNNIDEFCQANMHHPLALVRAHAQKEIMQQMQENSHERFFTLEMPTGYGKTITSLKLATWLGMQKGYRKIIYVAPYLSILEQTGSVIEEVMDIDVLEHHSLAILDKTNDTSSREREQRIPRDYLAMESWAHSVVCTSFQQWAKALFPQRAQDVLRRAFLRDSVVIIDEPQIFNPNSWNVFLCGLEALAELYNFRVIFLSATMPPFKYGLSKSPIKLSVQASVKHERYKIVNCEKMDEVELAQFLKKKEYKTQAAILNTIEDAFRVYCELQNDDCEPHLLHGLMVPLHKKVEINKIKAKLKKPSQKPWYVISTQVLEAGVDVSFEHVVRSLPVLPSIIQAAGRVNRHFESEAQQGILSVVPFYRGGEKNTRNSIYKSKSLRDITDQLLYEKDVWLESEVLSLIQRYYEKMFKQNTYEAQKKVIREAYEGNWEELAKFEPFGQDYLKVPLFVPWQVHNEDLKWLPPKFLQLHREVGIFHPEVLYERYRDKCFMSSLSFEERKNFMILFHYYVLNIPVKLALKMVGKEDYLQNRIPILFGDGVYDQNTGLTTHFSEEHNIFI